MAIIEKFLGRRVEIPEDRRYETKQGLWVNQNGSEFIFGLTEPALVLLGGIKGLDWLVPQGETVEKGTSVIFAVTGKILYIDTPLAGIIHFNASAQDDPSMVAQDPYGRGWLFTIQGPGAVLDSFLEHAAYLESLRITEGFKNPEGIKGGMSGICKAVYMGIGAQKT